MKHSPSTAGLVLGSALALLGCEYEPQNPADKATRTRVVQGIGETRQSLMRERSELFAMETKMSGELAQVRGGLEGKATWEDAQRTARADPRIREIENQLAQIRLRLSRVEQRLNELNAAGAPLKFDEPPPLPKETPPAYGDTLKDLAIPKKLLPES